jgi:uncharacterized protein (DUF433 family)
MTTLDQAEHLVSHLTRSDKAKPLQSLIRHLGDGFPGIESQAEICGGEPRIVRTRIPVWILERARRLGTDDAELLRAYPTLRTDDLTNAWAYVESHRDEIDQQIRENESD